MYIAALKTKIVPECKKIAQVSSYADDDGNNNGVSVPVCLQCALVKSSLCPSL